MPKKTLKKNFNDNVNSKNSAFTEFYVHKIIQFCFVTINDKFLPHSDSREILKQ